MFKIGDYAISKFGTIIHITDKCAKEIINSQADKFKHAAEKEIEQYHDPFKIEQ